MDMKDPYPIEHLNAQLKKVVNFLTPLLPLANSHLVQFISQDQWNEFLPTGIQQDLLNLEYSSLKYVSTAELYELPPDYHCSHMEILSSLQNFLTAVRALHAENLSILSPVPELENGYEEQDLKVIEGSMSKKKAYEVKNVSGLVSAICKDKKPDWIVDIGSGLGYLSSTLLIQHQLNVLAMDSSRSNIANSLKQSQIMKSLFERGKRPSAKNRRKQITNTNEGENHLSFNNFNGKFLGVTKFITNEENLPKLISEAQANNEDKTSDSSKVCDIGLVGLHTCGNLAPTCLKLFVNNPSAHFVCNVGCCYHLLVEEFCEDIFIIKQKIDPKRQLDIRYHTPELDPYHGRKEAMSCDAGFPLCLYLKSIKFCLGRNARDLASKPTTRLSTDDKNLQPLFWRALFEQIVTEVCGSWPEGARVGRKISKRCSNFYEYCQKCFLSIGISCKLTEEEISSYYGKYKAKEDEMVRFFFLKSSLAPLIETLISLDRLLYIQEQGFVNSHLLQVFDNKISPRCTAVVAFK